MLLDIDLGELPDEPEALYACAHLANIACGGHAGDEASMRRAVALCIAHGTRVGAHPSYTDRAGFGRRPMEMAAGDLRTSVAEQCARLLAHALRVREVTGVVVRDADAHRTARRDWLDAREELGDVDGDRRHAAHMLRLPGAVKNRQVDPAVVGTKPNARH